MQFMTQKIQSFILLAAALPALAACEPTPTEPAATNPQDVFFERLNLLCNKAYSGSLVSSVYIPFHIGANDGKWDRSRTWIITRTADGIRLKHRHRHEDGTLDSVTNYGGDTAGKGRETRQEFPVDAETIASFKANDLEQSVTNT